MDQFLAALTRRAVFIPGAWRGIERLRRCYAARYQGHPDRWTVINDYDGDLKFKLDRSAYMGSCIYWQRFHAFNEICLLNKLLKPQMVFVDVGANQGEFSTFAAKRLTQGKVMAFEPVKSLYQHLLENIQLNDFKNVVAYNYGLSDKPGRFEVYTSSDLKLHHSFHEGLVTMFPTNYRSTSMGAIEVKVFDHVFEELKLGRLDIMKVDVEGSELPVLQGACQTLKKHKPIIISEISEETFNSAGYKTGDLIDFLKSLGYEIFFIRARGRLIPIKGLKIPNFCNMMCR